MKPRLAPVGTVSGQVGESVRRPDGVLKVRGDFPYSSDLQVEGMLWGATVRSPHPYARIVSIDTSEARSMPGVTAVLTHEDVPGRKLYGLEIADHLKFPDFALIYLRHPASPFEVELTVNFDRKEAYALGDGYGHLAVVVDDVDAEHARFEREKLSPGPLRDFKHDGKTLARFFFVADPDGYKIEVIQRGGRFG